MKSPSKVLHQRTLGLFSPEVSLNSVHFTLDLQKLTCEQSFVLFKETGDGD